MKTRSSLIEIAVLRATGRVAVCARLSGALSKRTMITGCVLFSALILLLAGDAASQDVTRQEQTDYGSSSGTAGYRRLITHEEDGDRTRDTWVVVGSSVNGGDVELLEVQQETIRIDEGTTRVTREQFRTDSDGRKVLLETVEEERIEDPDGDVRITRAVSETDANGRSQLSRRETETTVSGPDGTYETDTEISRPGINQREFVSKERVLESGRNDADGRILESDRTSYSDPTGQGNWEALERRLATHRYGEQETSTTEDVYRQDASGELILNERVVAREWTDAEGRERTTEDVYSTDIPGQRSLREPRLLRQVSVTRTETSNGGWEVNREVSESRQGRFRVVERETEIARGNRNGTLDIEHRIERLDANGRMRVVQSTSSSESQP